MVSFEFEMKKINKSNFHFYGKALYFPLKKNPDGETVEARSTY